MLAISSLWRSLRYLADSNRRIRFCRPVPSHSAKVPFCFAVTKVDKNCTFTNLQSTFFVSILECLLSFAGSTRSYVSRCARMCCSRCSQMCRLRRMEEDVSRCARMCCSRCSQMCRLWRMKEATTGAMRARTEVGGVCF